MRIAIVLGLLAIASPALADDDATVGAACQTTADCGELRCIEGVCRDPLSSYAAPSTLGDDVMFGSRHGYPIEVAVIDVSASLVEPLLLLGANNSSGEQQTLFGVACFIPVSLAGSITHWAHGRVVPGVISMFAWASHAATTFVVGGLFGLAFENNGFEFNTTAAWAAGLVFGAMGAAALTSLDVWMARTVPSHAATALRVLPSLAPTRGGAMAGVEGTF